MLIPKQMLLHKSEGHARPTVVGHVSIRMCLCMRFHVQRCAVWVVARALDGRALWVEHRPC